MWSRTAWQLERWGARFRSVTTQRHSNSTIIELGVGVRDLQQERCSLRRFILAVLRAKLSFRRLWELAAKEARCLQPRFYDFPVTEIRSTSHYVTENDTYCRHLSPQNLAPGASSQFLHPWRVHCERFDGMDGKERCPAGGDRAKLSYIGRDLPARRGVGGSS